MTATLGAYEATSRGQSAGLGATLRDRARRLSASPPARFLAVGAIGLAADMLVFASVSRAGLPDAAARAASLGTATFVTWQLNRRITFGSSGRRPGHEAVRYAAVALSVQGFNYALFLALRSALPEMAPFGAILASAACAATASFMCQRRITFRPPASPRSGR